MSTSYFVGLFWHILVQIQQSIGDEHGTFLTEFGLDERTEYYNAIAATYFAFTSLSTVGFGDYYPVSETEKIFGAFILMFGVAIFSMVMSNFSEILLNEDLDDSDNLDKFLNVL